MNNNNKHQTERDPLQGFRKYLEKQGLRPKTIHTYVSEADFYLKWLSASGTTALQADYSDILVFIEYCSQEAGFNLTRQRKMLAIARKYYSYLQTIHEGIKNPATGLYLRGEIRTVPGNLLEWKELQKLYENYLAYDLRTKRNKVILSLLINQALTTGELQILEPLHIKLQKAKLEIPGSYHRNGRVLELKGQQITLLQEYLYETRPVILDLIKKAIPTSGHSAENPDIEKLENQLIISTKGATDINNIIHQLIKSLKKQDPKIENAKQIRQSVISHWLKTEDVRMVQYMAGHRYVSSTERYKTNDLEELKTALKVHHPLQ